jgi:ribosome-binding protein aMBF1 (putative translation factor)
MVKRIVRTEKLSPEEVARQRAVRAEFTNRPSKSELLSSGNYAGPMSLEEYLDWRKEQSEAPLSDQLRAAIAACGLSTNAVAQAAGVPSPVVQRFLSGQRGITLETAGKLARYLGLALLPEQAGQ